MNKKNRMLILVILILIISVFIGSAYIENNKAKENPMYYMEYITTLGKENKDEVLDVIEKILDDNSILEEDRALNLLAKVHYNLINRNYNEVIDSLDEVESILMKLGLQEELLHLYSIAANVYSSTNEQLKVYRYINKGEILATELIKMSKKDLEKKKELQSTLLAIKSMKVTVAIEIGIEEIIDSNFDEFERYSNENLLRERSDVFYNKLLYYSYKEDYSKVEEYSNKVKNITNMEIDIIDSNLILADTYIKQDRVEEAIKIINETLELKDFFTDGVNEEIHILYSDIYTYYNDYNKAIEQMEISYEYSEKTGKIKNMLKIVDQIISLKEKQNEDATKWYKINNELNKRINKGNLAVEFLIGYSLDNRLDNASDKIQGLKVINFEIIIVVIIILIIIMRVIFKLKKNNVMDGLTSCYNRRYFNETYSKLLSKNKEFHLVMIDIDDFKKINDSFGHEFGDKVLIEVSSTIKSYLSKFSKVYRYGGEELVIIVRSKKNEVVFKKVENIRKAIESLTWEYDTKVTMSIGISDSVICKEKTLTEADEKLYISKKTGKNKTTI